MARPELGGIPERCRFLILLILFFHFRVVSAQEPSFNITRFGFEQGLSESHVYSIIQDRNGFLWMGTRDGLNRFDGYEFKVYRNDPLSPNSISDSYIYSLFEDSKGLLWVGSRGGLNRFNPSTEEFTSYRHQEEDPQSLSHNTVNDIVNSGLGDGNLWVGTSGGLNYFNTRDGVFKRYLHDPENEQSLASDDIMTLALDRERRLWVGLGGAGLAIASIDNPGQFQQLTAESHGLSADFITSLFCDAKGRMWVGSSGGLDRWDPEVGRFETILSNETRMLGRVWAIDEDANGYFWVGSDDGGLFRLSPNLDEVLNWSSNRGPLSSLAHSSVISILIDRNNTLWTGSVGGGVSHLAPNSFSYSDYLISQEVVSAMEGRNGTRWIGTLNGLIQERNVDGTLEISQPFKERIADPVLSLLEDENGDIWAATRNNGLFQLKRDGTLSHYRHYLSDPDDPQTILSNNLMGLELDSRGDIWIASSNGLNRMMLNEPGVFTSYKQEPGNPHGLSDNSIIVVYADKPAIGPYIWVGSWNGGLSRMSLDKPGHFIHFEAGENPGDLSASAVFTIFRDSSMRLWVGSAGGLNCMNGDGASFRRFYVKDGLPSNTIYKIQEDGHGRLWLSTPNGLSRFNPIDNSFQNYNRFDGLAVVDFRMNSGYKSANGRLHFGGAGGLIDFNPVDINIDTQKPQIMITGFEVDNLPMPLMNQYFADSDTKHPLARLSYKNRTLEWRFAALHYAASAKNGYAYQLKGFDPDWKTTTAQNRTAVYTNLDPGSYTFKVKGSNKDGLWSDVAHYDFYIPPSPLRSWWANALYILFLLCMIGWYMRYMHIRLESQRKTLDQMREMERLKDAFNRELEVKVSKRTRELVGARNQLLEAAHAEGMADIACEILHNMGNTLNSVRTSAHLIGDLAADESTLHFLKRVSGLFRDHEHELAAVFKGNLNTDQVPIALDRIHKSLTNKLNDIRIEGDKLQDLVQMVVAALAEQQAYLHQRGWLKAPGDLAEFLEEALTANGYLIENVTLKKQFQPVAPVLIDRPKFSRIIFFLLKNAVEAMAENGPNAELSFTISGVPEGVVLTISDNGGGIEEQCKKSLFSRGFTTRKGHEGFGLHYCANAMKELGGSIELHSEGLNQGATVTLFFPFPNPDSDLEPRVS